jgi:prephenate dehydratase
MKRIAFLGPIGTVSEEAARYFFAGALHVFVPYRLMEDVLMATVTGETDASIVPIENTMFGSVKNHVDLLVQTVNLPILAEWLYPSIQNLIGRVEQKSEDANPFAGIKKIISIEVAIDQCREYLREHLPHVEIEFVTSTAEGVRLVKDNPGEGLASIGTKLAAELYGLDLLAENITDHNNNFTRFILVGNHPLALKPTDAQKTTILVTLPEDYPGALHQVLSAFAWRRINLSRIESRPTKLKLGSYYFYMDIEATLQSVLLPNAIAEIEAIGCQVRILGSYPSYHYETANTEV